MLRVVCETARLVGLGAVLVSCHPKTKQTEHIEAVSQRSYVVISPSAARGPTPVLFALHAYATDPQVLLDAYELPRRAAQRGMLLVVPRGTLDAGGKLAWNATRACCGEGPRRSDDLVYLTRVFGEVASRYSVDRDQVFALGVSNGGFMVHRWACAENAELDAFVSIAGAGVGEGDPPCQPKRPVSVLHVHGDHDETITAAGLPGPTGYPSARATVDAWCSRNGCEGAPERDLDEGWFGNDVEMELRRSAGARVALWTVRGGNHDLPEAVRRVDGLLDFLLAE